MQYNYNIVPIIKFRIIEYYSFKIFILFFIIIYKELNIDINSIKVDKIANISLKNKYPKYHRFLS